MTVDEERPIVKKTLKLGVVLVLLGSLIPCIALYFPYRPEGESLESWFQRSGSVMVIFAVWAEVKLASIYSMLNPTGLILSDGDLLRIEFGSYYNYLVPSVAAVAVLGTIIWGYGDLLI